MPGTPSAAFTAETLLGANEAFYKAFEALDMAAMAGLWEESEHLFCVHPGWQALRGRQAVLESWEVILANTTRIRFTLTGIEARIAGDLGIVTLHEHIISQVGQERHSASAVCTNLFAFHGEAAGWKLFHHHASLTAHPDENEGPVN